MKQIYIGLAFLLLMTQALAAPLCSSLFSSNGPKTAVFRLPHNEEVIETTTDGPAYRHIHMDKWEETDFKFKKRILEDTKKTGEPVLELSGQSPESNKVFEIETKEGFGVTGGLTKLAAFGFGNSTGVRLKVSSWDPNSEITIYFRNNYLGTMQSATFKVGSEPTDVYLPWKDFKSEYTTPRRSATQFEFGFNIKTADAANSKDSKFAIRFHGPLVYERDLRETLMSEKTLTDFLVNMDHSLELSMPQIAGFRGNFQVPNDGRTVESNTIMLRKAFKSLYDPAVQAEIAAIPEAQVLSQLQAFGYRFIYLKGKVSQPEFFGDIFNYISPENSLSTSPYLETGKHTPSLPIETGIFATDHGAISHARQVLALTHDLTPLEKKQFMGFIGSMFGTNTMRWSLWDIIFDAPGNTLPNSPRFWRDLEQQ